MHVVHLETGRRLYGGARQALALARGLQAQGLTNTMVCTAGSLVAAEAERVGLPVRTMSMRGDPDLFFMYRFTRLLRELTPDLVHVHSRRGADWYGAIAARRVRVPAVLSRRVDRPEGRLGVLKYPFYRWVVAISSAIREQLLAAGVAPGRIEVIRSAVDAERVEPAWSRERLAREFQLDPRCQLVGCVAQLIPRKGHDLLLAAWRDVAAACPDARLILFGRGHLDKRLRKAAQKSGIEGSVVFAGFRPDLLAFLGRLDLVVHTALEEGLGLALLEAQAAGVPVVAYRAGGVPEVVADGRTGYLVRSGDTPALALAMTGLLQDEARRRAFGEAAWDWVAREFRVADMVSRYLTLYREATETQRPS
jgi:glycosyltransferase involved in cell wall biosynthesis